MDLKFMQELHNKEFQTQEALAQRTTTIIAAITTLAGATAFLLINAAAGNSGLLFYVLVGAATVALIAASVMLAYSYGVQPLDEISRPKEWLEYWNKLKAQEVQRTIVSAEAAFTEYLLHQYADIGERNIDSNVKRGTRLVHSNRLLLAGFAFTVAASIAFYLNNYVYASAPTSPATQEFICQAKKP